MILFRHKNCCLVALNHKRNASVALIKHNGPQLDILHMLLIGCVNTGWESVLKYYSSHHLVYSEKAFAGHSILLKSSRKIGCVHANINAFYSNEFFL